MKPLKRRILITLLSLTLASLRAAEFALEVRNGAFEQENRVLSHHVTPDWAAQRDGHTLAERHSDGTLTPVASIIDTSEITPVLCWLMPDKSAPNATRDFAWIPGSAPMRETPLKARLMDDRIEIENTHYKLHHALRGGGGVPAGITFLPSGEQDNALFFLDRIVRKSESGGFQQYMLQDYPDATAHLALNTPLRVVVESRSGFGSGKSPVPGNPRVTYRYVYTAHSPLIEVTARYQREDDGPWRELHFLHLSRCERRYDAFVLGDAPVRHRMQPQGAPSTAVRGGQWGVMEDARNACGVCFEGVIGWDKSDGKFVYYLRSDSLGWRGPTKHLSGALFLGPKLAGEGYNRWMGNAHQPRIEFKRDGEAWMPQTKQPIHSAHQLENSALRLHFANAEYGFDLTGIEHLLMPEPVRFVKGREGEPGLWELSFKNPGPDTAAQTNIVVNNHTRARRLKVRQRGRRLEFLWKGIDLADEQGVVDVCAEVGLKRGFAPSLWRIHVDNRSKRYGLHSTSFPMVRGVTEPGTGSVLLPQGNWGGQLLHNFKGRFNRTYPSARCPVQMAAFNLGYAGLYLGAHDGKAWCKDVRLTGQRDFTFETLAANAAVPGAAGTPDFPVVIAAYRGTWHHAARIYRHWALQQQWCAKGPIAKRSDYPKRLIDLGFWMLLTSPERVQPVVDCMKRAAALYEDVPIGVHWYRWHEIPFDHSYPEYFPAKEGMREATRTMTEMGITVMPYINGKLWDSEIPSFTNAFPYTCKQPDHTNYIEIYGTKRRLSPMCPCTPYWQRKVREICHRLFEECGVNAIYLDQIAASRPSPCYDPTHGHPIGGGHHWCDGYRQLLTPIKREAARRGAILTSENVAENYMDNIDAFLTWSPCQNEDVPLLPLIYSGYTTYFSSPQSHKDGLDAFCATQCRDFLWGCQLGWNPQWILADDQREKQEFQHKLCRYRLAAKEFMVYGQLLDEIEPLGRAPLHKHTLNYRNPHPVYLPAVMATLWRDRDNRLALFIVNNSAREQSFDFEFSPERWLKGRGPWRLSQLSESGVVTPLATESRHLPLGSLPPREVLVIICARE